MKAVRLSADGEMTLRDLLALRRGAGGERLASLEALYERRRVQDQLTMSLGPGERQLRVVARESVWWAGAGRQLN